MGDLRSEPPFCGAEFRVVAISGGPWHSLLARFFERQSERERAEFHMGQALLSEIESNPVARYFGVVRPAGPGLVGFLGSWFVEDEAEIHHFYLDPSFRGRGLGFRLMSRFLSYAESAGVRRVFLEVRESNRRALELYSSLGFSPSGVRPNYYQGPSEDAILMVYNSGTVEGDGTGNPSLSSGPVSIEGPLA